jgi:hypothetical protein
VIRPESIGDFIACSTRAHDDASTNSPLSKVLQMVTASDDESRGDAGGGGD